MQFATVGDEETNKVYVVVENAEGAVLENEKVVVWTATTTDAKQGYQVELPTAVIGTDGIDAKVAGVVDSTIDTAATGRLQIYGPATVRASASLNVSMLVVTNTNNATNIGHVYESPLNTDQTPSFHGAIVGWTMENGPTATQSRVMLSWL